MDKKNTLDLRIKIFMKKYKKGTREDYLRLDFIKKELKKYKSRELEYHKLCIERILINNRLREGKTARFI